MADNTSNSATNEPSSTGNHPPQTHDGHNDNQHVMPAPPQQSDTVPRKRPKYTRSKTGCMTCRVKKIKCDETKPNCMRCIHGQRECTWPEGVPARKKATARKDLSDGKPSIACSESISEGSTTPPTREPSPPMEQQRMDLNTIPLTANPASVNCSPSDVTVHPAQPTEIPGKQTSTGPLDSFGDLKEGLETIDTQAPK